MVAVVRRRLVMRVGFREIDCDQRKLLVDVDLGEDLVIVLCSE